jgi:hypothetical protein
MDPSQPNSREYQRQAIDTEIQSLEEYIRVLKHRRNALAPVSSLPTEVINAIFFFARVTVSNSSAPPGKKSDTLAWLRVSHVCHQWREIALNQPLFWNHVNFTALSSAGAAEMLARAKTVPLYLEARFIRGHWNKDRRSAFQEALQVYVFRTRHLLISADCWDLPKTLDSAISGKPVIIYEKFSSKGFNLIGSFVSARRAGKLLGISGSTVIKYMNSGEIYKDRYKFSSK